MLDVVRPDNAPDLTPQRYRSTSRQPRRATHRRDPDETIGSSARSASDCPVGAGHRVRPPSRSHEQNRGPKVKVPAVEHWLERVGVEIALVASADLLG